MGKERREAVQVPGGLKIAELEFARACKIWAGDEFHVARVVDEAPLVSPDDAARARALNDGALCYLTKPFGDDDLLGCVRRALEP